jgi:hypothetical protein
MRIHTAPNKSTGMSRLNLIAGRGERLLEQGESE